METQAFCEGIELAVKSWVRADARAMAIALRGTRWNFRYYT